MKRVFLLVFTCILVAGTTSAQLDRSIRPQPGPAPIIQLGEFESFTLDNGLRVIVVENRRIPVVSFQLTLDIDPKMEGDATGFVSFSGALMREGTTNRNKEQLDNAIDFIGATLSTTSSGMFGSSLTRHKETLLDLMSDVLLNPSFPEQELQMRINQNRSGLQTVRANASSIAQNLVTTQIFGPYHPYGEILTDETIENITRDKLVSFYETYWKPNVAYMVVVGDIDASEARTLMNRFFGSWEKGDVPTHSYPIPQPPAGRRVAFAERAGATQSVIRVGHPVLLPIGHEDAIKVSVMNSILGGGAFSGRLIQNLREEKGFTYGANSSLTSDRIVGRFLTVTEVRNSATDSTVTEILHEMNRLINEPVSQEELSLTQNFMNGQFARSLESPRTMANFALNIKRFNLPDDYYANYLTRLWAVTPEDVQAMAAKYLKPDNSVIIVVGNMDEVPQTLEKFSATGEVEFFDAFGRPWTAPELTEVPRGVTLQTVLDKYINAIGGKTAISSITDKKQVIEFSLMGQTAVVNQFQKAPNLLRVDTEFGGMTVSTQIFDGTKGAMRGMMGNQIFTEGPEFEMMKMQAIMNMETNYEAHGIVKTLEGIANVDGKKAYRVLVETPSGQNTHEFYDVETGLKLMTQSDMGVSTFSSYKKVVMEKEGPKPGFFARLFGRKPQVERYELMFPDRITQEMGGQVIEMTVTEILLNSGFESALFEIN